LETNMKMPYTLNALHRWDADVETKTFEFRNTALAAAEELVKWEGTAHVEVVFEPTGEVVFEQDGDFVPEDHGQFGVGA
jgi:hypothetical protein